MNTTLWEKKMAITDESTHSYNPIKVINDVSKINWLLFIVRCCELNVAISFLFVYI